MPEITEAMYCHQQICIPPTFPYLLRQYAKAAVRSQPNDLLRWSCSYFRALSLGLKPPVKLRLEYPIIRTQYGLTPGWLKTLIHQFAGYSAVTWPQLYDKWNGIGLHTLGLQEIIMIGGFNDAREIPWFKFIATAAGFLTQNLTTTMILICELLTEEPEGGSSMLPYYLFADLYEFLAKIEACEHRNARNFYFTESNLDLTKKEILEEMEQLDRSLVSTKGEEEEESYEILDRRSDLVKYLRTIANVPGEEDTNSSRDMEDIPEDILNLDSHSSCYIILDPEDGKPCKEKHSKEESSSESSESSEKDTYPDKLSASTEESADTVEMIDVSSQPSMTKRSEESSTETEITESKIPYVDMILPVVPGIGAEVPEDMIEAVLKYLKHCANGQQGMVMPRNIKHFMCPPLERCLGEN